jgi:hypothetical protein
MLDTGPGRAEQHQWLVLAPASRACQPGSDGRYELMSSLHCDAAWQHRDFPEQAGAPADRPGPGSESDSKSDSDSESDSSSSE